MTKKMLADHLIEVNGCVGRRVFTFRVYVDKRCQSIFPVEIGNKENWPGAILKVFLFVFQDSYLVKFQKRTSMWGLLS